MTQDKSPFQELKDALANRDSRRAREIKAIWRICFEALPPRQQRHVVEDSQPGQVLGHPDPENPMADLNYEKIVYDGGTVIECEGVVVCRVK